MSIIYYSVGCTRPRNICTELNNWISGGKPSRAECLQVIRDFPNVVQHVLSESNGWQNIRGVKFVRIGENDIVNSRDVVRIWLSTANDIDNVYCTGLRGMKENNLSCANLQTKNVWLNLDRWMFGGDFGQNLADYRRYVVNHEVGHAAFGLRHPECDEIEGEIAPVMLQQTYNLCKRLKLNPYPMEYE